MRYRNECMPLILSVDTVYYYDLRVAQLNNRNDFSPCFSCRKVNPCFFVYPPPAASHPKRVCNRASVCVLLLVAILLARVQTMCMCPNSYITTPSRPGTQPLVMLLCGFFWRSSRIQLRPRFSHACACHVYIHVCACTYRSSINNYTTMIPAAVPWSFFLHLKEFLFGTKYGANLEIMSCQGLFYQPLHTPRSKEQLESTVQNTKNCALFACLSQPSSALTFTLTLSR